MDYKQSDEDNLSHDKSNRQNNGDQSCCGDPIPPNRPPHTPPPGWKPGDPPCRDPLDGAINEDDLFRRFKNAAYELSQRNKDSLCFVNRKNEFLPYLVIRANPGDHGGRPLLPPHDVFWESPDIFIAPNLDASSAPPKPPTLGGIAQAGVPNTLWAHIWNLGLSPASNFRIEFYWDSPSLGPPVPHRERLIGVAYADLGDRYSTNSHTIVKCPTSWVPQLGFEGHECLVVKCFEPLTDPLGLEQRYPNLNRHIGQRNIIVIDASRTSPYIKDSEKNTVKFEIPLRLQCSAPQGQATIEIFHPKTIQDVKWLVLLETKLHVQLQQAHDPNEIYGLTYPEILKTHLPLHYRNLSTVQQSDLLTSIIFNRGCDELYTRLQIQITLAKAQCKIYRIHQTVNNQLVGGCTAIIYNKP